MKISSPQGRFEAESQLLDRKTLKRVEAHGKHLYYFFSNGPALHVHLGLYGKFRLLEIGMKYNRIITVGRNDTHKPLSKLNRDERLWIYKKDHCTVCASKTQTWLLGNRQIFACSVCQGLNS